MVRYIRENDLLRRIRCIIDGGPYRLCDYRGVGGSGGAGRLMEHLLEIDANNISVADAVEYEIKTGTTRTNLITLFHKEPQSRCYGFMREIVRHYGWAPTRGQYPAETLSFRHTVCATPSERGFSVVVDNGKVRVEFNPDSVAHKHADWLALVQDRGRGIFPPIPEWTVDELSRTGSVKLANCIYVSCQNRAGQVRFGETKILRRFLPSCFIAGLQTGDVFIDFDARTSGAQGVRNHGTKFRVRQSFFDNLYEETEIINSTSGQCP